MVELKKRGIFYLIEGENALRLASKIGVKLLEKKVTHSNGQIKVKVSCGFPMSGLDKYIGKLVRMGEDVEINEDGKIVEKIKVIKREQIDEKINSGC